MIFWWLVAPGFKKNGMELKGDLAYCWGGKSTGYEFEGMLVNLPPSCTSVCFRVCFPVKRRSFQKSLHSLERISSQPGKVSGQPGEGLQTASRKFPPARKTLDGIHTSQLTSSQAHSTYRLTPHTSHFTFPQIYRSTLHRIIPHSSHLTPHDDS